MGRIAVKIVSDGANTSGGRADSMMLTQYASDVVRVPDDIAASECSGGILPITQAEYDLLGLTTARDTADSVITALSPAAWYRNATDVVSSGGFASIWADYASTATGLWQPGVNSNYASTPDAAPLDITNDIEIIVRIAATDYTPAANSALVSKFVSGSAEAWSLYITATTGVLSFLIAGAGVYSSTVAPTCTDGTAYWFRLTRVKTTGKINFYQADDSATVPSSWTQVGTEVSGVTSAMISNGAAVGIGAQSNGISSLSGMIYRAIIRSTIGGAAVFDADFSSQAIGTASFTESSSNAATVTINTSGASPAHIGKARDLLQGTGTNQPAYAAGVFTFDGADNFMVASSWSMAQPVTYYLVGKQITWTNADSLVDGTTNETGLSLQLNASPSMFIYSGSAVADNTNWAVGASGILCAVFNGASSSLRINNTAKTTGNPGALAMGGVTLGSRANASFPAHMEAWELVVFNAAHSDAEQNSVITALNNALTVF